MKILLLSVCKKGSGNLTTASRLSQFWPDDVVVVGCVPDHFDARVLDSVCAAAGLDDNGTSLPDDFIETEWSLRVREPYFSWLADGRKTVELRVPGRPGGRDYNSVVAGDWLVISRESPSNGSPSNTGTTEEPASVPVADSVIRRRVLYNRRYTSFAAAVAGEQRQRCMPGCESDEDAIALLNAIPGYQQRVATHGVLALCIAGPDGVGSADVAAERRLMHALVRKHAPDAVVAIHAFKSGRFTRHLRRCSGAVVSSRSPPPTSSSSSSEIVVPTCLVLGGTDVNSEGVPCAADVVRTGTIFDALRSSSAIVCFHEIMRAKVDRLSLFQFGPKLHVVHPSVAPPPSHTGCAQSAASVLQGLGLEDVNRYVLLPCGWRPVKDPAFLLAEYSQWYEERRRSSDASPPPVLLVLAGCRTHQPKESLLDSSTVSGDLCSSPIGQFQEPDADQDIDQDKLSAAAKFAETRPGLRLVSAIEPMAYRALLASERCVAVANSSLNEGLANALLEAMQQGVPVVARANDGNDALLIDAISAASSAVSADSSVGWRYTTPGEFCAAVDRLLCDPADRRRRVKNARSLIQRHFNYDQENAQYVNILDNLTN